MKRFCLSLFVVIALFLSACGDKKEENLSSRLPQAVSILDDGLTFRLPEEWMTRTSPEFSATVTFYNTDEIFRVRPHPEDLPIAQRAFSDPLPDTLRRLGVEQNLVVGAVMVTAQDNEFSDQSPSAIVQAAFEGAGYTLEATEIKTFENGAWAYYRPEEGDLHGIVGVVKEGEIIAAVIIATDKLEEYHSTFEDIVRSIHLNPERIPTPTPEVVPTLPTLSVIPTTAPTQPPMTVTPVLTPAPPTSADPCIYIVQAGDSLSVIAIQYDISPVDLMEVNAFTEEGIALQIGQELRLPLPGCAESEQ